MGGLPGGRSLTLEADMLDALMVDREALGDDMLKPLVSDVGKLDELEAFVEAELLDGVMLVIELEAPEAE